MSRPRDEVVAALAAHAPASVRILPYARNIDPQSTTVALVRADRVNPHPAAPQSWRVYEFAVIVVPAKTSAGNADDELDDALEDVLHAIDQADDLTWESAERGNYQDSGYPAYEIHMTVHIDPTPPTP